MSNKDIIFISSLEIDTIIGINPEEKQNSQTVILDLEVTTNTLSCTKDDDLSKTINYQEIYDEVIKLVQNNSKQLIESLAEDIASFILDNFSVSTVKVTLQKPNALKLAKSAGITIERHGNN